MDEIHANRIIELLENILDRIERSSGYPYESVSDASKNTQDIAKGIERCAERLDQCKDHLQNLDRMLERRLE